MQLRGRFPPVQISLDIPVYKVDLVSLAPLASAPAVKKAPVVKPQRSKPDAVAIPESKPKAVPQPKNDSSKAAEVKPVPKPQPKPKPVPEPETKKISPKKVKTSTTPKKKPEEAVKEKPKPAEAKKEEAPKKVKAEKPKPVKPKEPEISPEDALAADLAALANDVEKKEKAERNAFSKDLASLAETAKATEISGLTDGSAGASGLVQVYGSIVKEAVRKNWRYPVFGQKNNLTASVKIDLKASGEISNVQLVESSGDADFDDSVLTALHDTEVLPEPPGNSIRSIIVNFNLQDLDQ